jgi:hypothetical protein
MDEPASPRLRPSGLTILPSGSWGADPLLGDRCYPDLEDSNPKDSNPAGQLQRAVAQFGRAPVSKTGGWGFESLLPCSPDPHGEDDP